MTVRGPPCRDLTQHVHGLGGGRHVGQHVAATAGAPQTGQITPKHHRGSDDRRHMRDH